MRKSVSTFVVTAVMVATLSLVGQAPASATPDHFVPQNGPVFNNPYGKTWQVRRLIRQVNRTIDSVPRGGKIRIASWNVRSYHIVSSLIRAHRRRNVSVQVVMDRHNFNPNKPNADAARLKSALKVGNKKRPKHHKSWVRRCIGSCRGSSGIAHTKLFLFNKVNGKNKKGKARTVRHVAMYGSYNATELGATIQWNDLYTIKRDYSRWAFFRDVFNQMSKDRARRQGWVNFDDGVQATGVYPWTGAGTNFDPIKEGLDSITCTGAATRSGRTKIRIAQTSMYGERGLMLARKLARMKKNGCNIRIVYAMFGNQVLKILRDADIPLTHLAWDNNEDGLYDRYVHMKSMAVSGYIGADPGAMITWNGSANWTPVALASDDVVGVIRKRGVTRKYLRFTNYMFNHRPEAWGPQHPGNRGRFSATGRPLLSRQSIAAFDEDYHSQVERRAERRGVDPYALIKQEN